MIINTANLRTLYTGFSTAFRVGLGSVQPLYQRVALVVPSSTRVNEYGWLGQFPRFREWLGDRAINNLKTHGYTIRNRSFENTIAVDRDDLEDDNLGMFAPLFTELGRLSATFPDELVWDLLKNGFTTPCFDGQYFFDADHPVLDATGKEVSVSNTGGGSGPAWFLMDASRGIKPIIYQTRRAFDMTRMDAATDEVVFNKKEYRYGVDGRCAAGYGFWQIIFGSKQTLTAAAYEAARKALATMKGDYGRPLGLTGNLLICGPSSEAAARKLLNSEYGTGGETNPWKGTAEVLVVPWLE